MKSSGYAAEAIAKFNDELQELRNDTMGVRMDLARLAQLLTDPRAQKFANEGISRRLQIVERSAINIYRIYPADKPDFLSMDDCSDVAIQLHAFAINLYALFDNVAWVCALEAGLMLPPKKIGVYSAACQGCIPADLKSYLAQPVTTTWFEDYGKVYRDSTAHRIAAYLPPRAFTSAEGTRWQTLRDQSMQLLLDASNESDLNRRNELLDQRDALQVEQAGLGSNSLLFALSLGGTDAEKPVYLHPQLLCDWALANEFVKTFSSAMRKHYGWPAPTFPTVRVP
jgi:hypothetical protein